MAQPRSHYGPHFIHDRFTNTTSSNTQTYWSRKDPDRLFIFIHGFKGDALKTWNNFPQYIGINKEFSSADIIFYGYDSLFTQVANSGLSFCEFIESFTKSNWELIPDSFAKSRKKEIRYNDITIISHSLGALVCRQALIEGKMRQYIWYEKTRMVLYAPAHHGNRLQSKLKAAFAKFGMIADCILAGMETRIVTLDDLDPKSIIIAQQKDAVNEACRKDDRSLCARAVFWCPTDLVVLNAPYGQDPPAMHIDQCNHLSICKPSSNNLEPLDKLRMHL